MRWVRPRLRLVGRGEARAWEAACSAGWGPGAPDRGLRSPHRRQVGSATCCPCHPDHLALHPTSHLLPRCPLLPACAPQIPMTAPVRVELTPGQVSGQECTWLYSKDIATSLRVRAPCRPAAEC